MREKNRNSIEIEKILPQFTTMNVIDGQAGLISYSSLIFYSLTIDNILNIIVLLILAGVSIAMLTGENGILTQAKKAKEETEEAKNNELEILEDYENRLNEKVIQSTFIWDPDIVNFTKLDAQVEKLNLNTIYVQITSDLETSISISKLISYCQLKNIDLYLLDGGSDWYTDEEKYNVIEMIDRTSEFNKTNNNAIKGIKLE